MTAGWAVMSDDDSSPGDPLSPSSASPSGSLVPSPPSSSLQSVESMYSGIFGKEFDDLPERPNIDDSIRAISLVVRRAARRVSDREGRSFRSDLSIHSTNAQKYLSEMMSAEINCNEAEFRKMGPKLSNELGAIERMSVEGVESIEEEQAFLDVALKLLKRVEAYEDLATKRASVLNEVSVRKLLETFSKVLLKYLPKLRAQQAFAEVMGEYGPPG